MRINLWAGAGAGKSTVASGLYYHLKCKNYNIELVGEYIKQWAYEKKVPSSYDQLYIFSKQLHAEDLLLKSGVQHLVTDSPVPMQLFYAKKFGFPAIDGLLDIARTFEKQFPSINIFLDRTGVPYQTHGRFQIYEEALQFDTEIRAMLESELPYHVFKSTDMVGLQDFVESVI